MKSTNILVLVISVLTISFWSCKPKEVMVEEKVDVAEEVAVEAENATVEGDCKYKTIEGKGEITRMNLSNPNEVVIKFNFIPSKSSGLEATEGHLFNVNGVGKYPPKDWCEKNGVKQGATFKVNMYQLTAGAELEACERTKFSFVDFEGKGWK